MVKQNRMYIILYIVMIFIVGCKKSEIAPVAGIPTINEPLQGSDQDTPKDTISYSRIYEVGTGSGNLTIDGKSLSLSGNVLIKIKGGKYQSIKISNINGAPGVVMIQNNGLVEMNNSQMRLQDLENVIISGNGTKEIDKGFKFTNNNYRPVEIDGSINNFTFQFASFQNIKDNVITYKYEKVYDGSEASYSKNLKFLNIDCDNTGQFLSGSGSVSNGNLKGYIKTIEIANLTFTNSPNVGSIVWLGNVEDYNIHHNVVDNINMNNNNHNGIFLLNGNGRFYNNKISNHQGNSIRAFCFTIGSSPKEILIYNNIVVNSRKYSAFEVQAFDNYFITDKTTYSNAKIFNNTCGNINMNKEWQGNVVDVYDLKGGTCTVFNNLAFNLPAPHIIAGQVSSLVPISTNNLYFNTSKEAGIVDEINFRLSASSPAKEIGISYAFLKIDYHGNLRSTKPSVGAVE